MSKKNINGEFIQIPTKLIQYNISATSMILYGVIYKMSFAMTQETFATNSYFAKLCNCSERTITRCLKELKDNNCIAEREDKDNKNIRYLLPKIINEVPYKITKKEQKLREKETPIQTFNRHVEETIKFEQAHKNVRKVKEL